MVMRRPRVVLVTARHRLRQAWRGADRSWQSLVIEQIRGAIAGGADLVQVREPDLEGGLLAAFLRALFHEVPDSQSRVVVNERLDVALTVGAAGVHLPERSLSPSAARALAPAEWWIGRSVHSAEAARRSAGASYLVAGTVARSASKPHAAILGWSGLGAIVEAARDVPVVAIGGLTERDVPQAVAAGAAGVAAIGYFIPEGDSGLAAFVEERVMQMRLAFDTAGMVPYTQGPDR